MSLAGLRRLSCTIFPSACGCKPSGAVFCSPISRAVLQKKAAIPNIGAARFLSSAHKPDTAENDKPATFQDKVKLMWKKYGKLAICTYLGVYVGTLSSLFVALDFGLLNASTVGFDHAAAIAKVCDIYETVTGSSTLPQYMKEHPTAGTLAVAWLITKFTEPLRLATTVAIVPSVSRYWNKLVNNKIENDAK